VIRVRPVTPADATAWLEMRCALWPDGSREEHGGEIEAFLAGRLSMPLAVLIAVDEAGTALGFVELFIRPYAEGCATDRVAFLEGWYVAPEARRRGVGRALIRASEDWTRAQGCREFASDALLSNRISAEAHRAVGFEVITLIRCFRKSLEEAP
jgi:aminoglycoside 6'-N-acetyltransferase I